LGNVIAVKQQRPGGLPPRFKCTATRRTSARGRRPALTAPVRCAGSAARHEGPRRSSC
jgi:hypothetical protein